MTLTDATEEELDEIADAIHAAKQLADDWSVTLDVESALAEIREEIDRRMRKWIL